jgi:hypothetical protein
LQLTGTKVVTSERNVTGKWSIGYGAPEGVALVTDQVADFEAALDAVVRQATEEGVGVRLEMSEELVKPIDDYAEGVGQLVQPSRHPDWRMVEPLEEDWARMAPPPFTSDIDYSFTVTVDPSGNRWCLLYGAPWGVIKASHSGSAERHEVSTRFGTSWDTMLLDFFIDADVARRAAIEFFEHRTLSSEVTWVDESPLAP